MASYTCFLRLYGINFNVCCTYHGARFHLSNDERTYCSHLRVFLHNFPEEKAVSSPLDWHRTNCIRCRRSGLCCYRSWQQHWYKWFSRSRYNSTYSFIAFQWNDVYRRRKTTGKLLPWSLFRRWMRRNVGSSLLHLFTSNYAGSSLWLNHNWRQINWTGCFVLLWIPWEFSIRVYLNERQHNPDCLNFL